jgi:Leucine-rich repeat (LRR) protein
LGYGIVICSVFAFVPVVTADEPPIERLKALGAEIETYGDPSGNKPLEQVEVNLKHWRGSSVDLELLEKIPKYKSLGVDAPHSRLGDIDVKVLAKLPHLISLDLSRTNVTGAALSYLSAAKDLKRLSLRETGITDGDLVALNSMGRLSSLDLSRTHIKGRLGTLPDGLESLILSGTRLESLNLVPNGSRIALLVLGLDDTGATDTMLGDVEKCPNLVNLWLQGTRVTDRGLPTVGSLRKLEMLRLDGTAITDAGLEAIRPLSEMRWLTLSGTKITDRGLISLGRLKKLEDVILTQTTVTEEGIHKLETDLGRKIETGVVPTDKPIRVPPKK